jgi:hypothetical protein
MAGRIECCLQSVGSGVVAGGTLLLDHTFKFEFERI